MNLATILEKTVSSDKNELETAQQYLQQASVQNLSEFLKQLSDVLKHGNNSPISRMQAGIQLKNALYSKDPSLRLAYQQRWMTFPDDLRRYIKINVLETLGSETTRPSTAAQCVAYIACAELPQDKWPELMQVLTSNVANPTSTEMVKEASLEAVGYTCQDTDPEILQTKSYDILTAILSGMKKEEPSNHIRLVATNALLNSLEFTKADFDKDRERHFIMQVVCEATQSPDTQVRVAALQCLVKIMSLYYQYMEHFMGPALYAITLKAMKSTIDQVALQGIEFWSTVCDEEVDLAIEAAEAAKHGRPPERISRHYAKGALQYLVSILTQNLTKQEEFDDGDDWNPRKASGVCLMLLASCCEDDIVPHVLPFVTEQIKSPDWRFRDAAVMAFGSILEGPNSDSIKHIVEKAMPTLIELLKDSSIQVRDTAAWTVGRVCKLLPGAVINGNFLNPLLSAMVEGLTSEPRVAANVCQIFPILAEAAYKAAEIFDDRPVPATYCLSSCYEPIVQKLLEATDRSDGYKHNLSRLAYQALMEMVKCSPMDCYKAVQKITILMFERLQRVLQTECMFGSSSDKIPLKDLKSLFCATSWSILQKVNTGDINLQEDISTVEGIKQRSLLVKQSFPLNSVNMRPKGLYPFAVHGDNLNLSDTIASMASLCLSYVPGAKTNNNNLFCIKDSWNGKQSTIFKGTFFNHDVVVKRIESRKKNRIINEIETFERLKLENKNIIQLWYYVEYEDHSFFIFPCIDYSLMSLINMKKLKLKQLNQILLQALRGICGLHRNNTIHGSIEPAHILVKFGNGENMEVSLTNFRKAHEISSSHWTDFDRDWASPELKESDFSSIKSDIYSFGLTAMWSWKNVLRSEEDIISVTVIQKDQTEFDIVDKNIKISLDLMLESDPEKRINAIDAMKLPCLDRFLKRRDKSIKKRCKADGRVFKKCDHYQYCQWTDTIKQQKFGIDMFKKAFYEDYMEDFVRFSRNLHLHSFQIEGLEGVAETSLEYHDWIEKDFHGVFEAVYKHFFNVVDDRFINDFYGVTLIC